MSLQDEFAAGMAAALSEMGEPVKIGGVDYTAIPGDLNYSGTFSQGGELLKNVVQFIVTKAAMPTIPSFGAAILYQGQKLAVLTIDEDAVSWTITAYNPNTR